MRKALVEDLENREQPVDYKSCRLVGCLVSGMVGPDINKDYRFWHGSLCKPHGVYRRTVFISMETVGLIQQRSGTFEAFPYFNGNSGIPGQSVRARPPVPDY